MNVGKCFFKSSLFCLAAVLMVSCSSVPTKEIVAERSVAAEEINLEVKTSYKCTIPMGNLGDSRYLREIVLESGVQRNSKLNPPDTLLRGELKIYNKSAPNKEETVVLPPVFQRQAFASAPFRVVNLSAEWKPAGTSVSIYCFGEAEQNIEQKCAGEAKINDKEIKLVICLKTSI